MATLETFLVLSFLILQVATGAKTCKPLQCPGNRFLSVRFPFRLKESQPEQCGYPGFDLSCNNRSQPIISMLIGGDFTVNDIDYWREKIQVNDPQHCMPGRLLNFAVDFPFQLDFTYQRSFTYLNCTANTMHTFLTRFPCLSGHNYTVGAMLSDVYNHLTMKLPCRVIKIVQVPSQFWDGSGSGLYADIWLTWAEPDCGACESNGGSCGFKSSSSLEIACSHTRGAIVFSKRAKYGIMIGVGVFGFVLLVGLVIRNCAKANESESGHQPATGFSTFVAPQSDSVVVLMGLSESDIEMYPKLILGESDQLPPNFDDNSACPICLSQYRVKEEVRVIPNCKHYFHVNCIDEWLKRNVTCPLCRTSLEEQPSSPSSLVTLSLLPSSTRR